MLHFLNEGIYNVFSHSCVSFSLWIHNCILTYQNTETNNQQCNTQTEGRKGTSPVRFPTLGHRRALLWLKPQQTRIVCELTGQWIQNFLWYFTHHLREFFLLGLDMTERITLKASYWFIFHKEVLRSAYRSLLLGNLFSFTSRTALSSPAGGMWHFKWSM